MKAIVLAGGAGTRLHPATSVISKHLLPVYDKPMIYYPVTTAIMAGATEILVISTPAFLSTYEALFRHGRQIGIPFAYEPQPDPRGGIAEAFLIGAQYIGGDPVMLVLGDNIFLGLTISDLALPRTIDGAHVVAYQVPNPQHFGVIKFDQSGDVAEIVEKPENPISNWIVPGLYFYSNDVVQIARSAERSGRRELEITAVNQEYHRQRRLHASRLPAYVKWFDCGSPDALLDASNVVARWEREHDTRVGCPAEASYRRGLIKHRDLDRLCTYMQNEEHRRYLRALPQRVGAN
jgi:glucose-1-phosphate thymidylyltransferase